VHLRHESLEKAARAEESFLSHILGIIAPAH
jgi:hypothetical protein